jgi:hypothetical protein
LPVARLAHGLDTLRGDITLCVAPGSPAAHALRRALRDHGLVLNGAVHEVALDRSIDGDMVLVVPPTEFLLVLDEGTAHDIDHAVDLLAALLRSDADIALSRPDVDAPFDALAARAHALENLEGSFVGLDRLVRQGKWRAGVVVTRTDGSAIALQSLQRDRSSSSEAAVPARRPIVNPFTVVAVALVVQLGFIFGAPKSPFTDESIYIVMGQRALGGLTGDRFLSWVTGSRLYPAAAATISASGGYQAISFLSAVMVGAAALMCGRAARNLGHPELELPTVAAVLVPGVMLWFGHQINHDVGVLLGLGAALWCVSRFHVTQRRSRLAWAGIAAAAAGLSAYAGLFMLAPLSLLVVQQVGLRQWKRAIPFFVAAAVPLAIYAVRYNSSLVRLSAELERQSPGLVEPRSRIIVELAFIGLVPLVLALIGLGRSALPWLMRLVMLLALVLMPAIHLATGVNQAAVRHSSYGIVLASPLLGAGLQRLVRRRDGHASTPRFVLAVAVLGSFGAAQAVLMDDDWVDLRPTLGYLDDVVRTGDTILTEHQWPVTEHLLTAGNLDDPWDVYSSYRIEYEGRAPSYCSLDWYVEDSSDPADAPSRAAIDACGAFVPVFTQAGSHIRFTDDLRYERTEAVITVWRNDAPRTAATNTAATNTAAALDAAEIGSR